MPRRRRSDWGTVDVIERGRKYRIRWWGADEDGAYRRHCETFVGTWRQAQDRRAELRLAHSSDARVATVGEAHSLYWVPWADRRLESGEMSANARRQFDSAWRRHVAPRWEDVPLDGVRPPDVEEWLLSKTRSVALQCKTVLSRVMDRARFHGATTNDPFSARIDMPRAVPARGLGAHDADELGAIWDALRDTTLEPAFLLMAFGSCRVGESLGVRCAETTFGLAENDVPVLVAPIVRTVGRHGEVGPDGRLKTRESVRCVVLCGPMAERMRDVAASLAARGVEWLCDDGAGSPMGTTKFSRLYRAAASGAVAEPLPPQSLRRSWETIAHWTLRIDSDDRERMMGHKLPGVTGAHYDKPTASDFVRVASEAYAAHPFADRWAK